MKQICRNGCMSDEFKQRDYVNDLLMKMFWPLFLQNLKMWAKKGRKNDEEWMDALIEKSMTFFFDSLAPNIMDSLFDFLKHSKSLK